MPDFEIVDVPEPLLRALNECGKRYRHIRDQRMLAQTIARLIEPPASLQIPMPSRIQLANSLLAAVVPFDGDAAARMLWLDDGQPNSDAKWNALSRAQRKRAKRLWTWALDAGLDTTPQGRPPKIDAALVLYCARVVSEGCGQFCFKFSRPPGGGKPGGPMWKALLAALPLAEAFLCGVNGDPPNISPQTADRAEAVADILIISRSKEFRACCRKLKIEPSRQDIVKHPAIFRLALTRARALRNSRRKK